LTRYYPRATSLSTLVERATVYALAGELRSLARLQTAAGRGAAALLHCWGSAHRFAAQPLAGGLYVESCPAYVATVDGVTRWAAARGWEAVRALAGWAELSAAAARQLGAQLRSLPAGSRRGGRHLLIAPWVAAALSSAAGGPRSRPAPAPVVLTAPRAVQRLQRPEGPRALAVCCPAHRDRSPSLVLWRSGGALCMSCGWRAAWKIDGSRLLLFESCRPQLAENVDLVCAGTTKDPPQQRQPSRRPGAQLLDGPVGGMIATRTAAARHVGASLGAWSDSAGRWRLARTPGHRLAGDPVSALRVAESRSAGDAESGRAHDAAYMRGDLPGRAVLPDRLMSVSCMTRRSWVEPWRAVCQRWVLIDLDDVESLDDCADTLGDELLREAFSDPEIAGSGAVVRTGPTGLQIWLKLRHARHTPGVWTRRVDVQSWHARLGAQLLGVARRLGARAGHADPAVCDAGRFGRRPGWRIVDGGLYRSHLLSSVCDSAE